MNHPCPQYETELSAYLDAETTPALRAEIETHLRVCEACRAGVARLRGVSRVLRRWDAHETRYATSAGFRNRVFAKIGADFSPRPTKAGWRIAAAVALVAAGAGGFALVARRPRVEENADAALLVGERSDLRGLVTARTQTPTPSSRADAPATIERVDPLDPVVDAPAPDDDSSAPPSPPDTWEQRGDRRYLREALPEHDDFARERGTLRLEEQLRREQESRNAAQPNRPTQAAPAPSALATFLGEVRVGSGSFKPFSQVQVWPIELTGARGPEAPRPMACEKAILKELKVSESPDRAYVVAENSDPKRSVLVLAGDVLVGGAQDRVARQDMLIVPNAQISIPVYTNGRARHTTYIGFTSSRGLAPPDLRSLVAADHVLLAGGFGQDRFDDAVAETLKALVSTGGNGSLDRLFGNYRLSALSDPYLTSFEKRLDAANVVGLAVSAGSRLLGVEVFGDHATFLEHRARLVRSYVLAALASSPDGTRLNGEPSRDAVVGLVTSAQRAEFHDEPPTVSGTISVFRGDGGVVGGAFGFGLLDGTRVVHALLFRSTPNLDGSGGRGGRAGAGVGGSPGDASSSSDGGHGGGNPSKGGESGEGGTNPK